MILVDVIFKILEPFAATPSPCVPDLYSPVVLSCEKANEGDPSDPEGIYHSDLVSVDVDPIISICEVVLSR